MLISLSSLTVRVFGAVWFAAIAGIGFPLSMAAFPGPSSQSTPWILSGVWAGVTMFGLPAALAGAITGTRIDRAGPLGAFLLGALTVVLTCMIAGFWMAAFGSRVLNLRAFTEDAFAGAFGMLVIDVIFLRGVPFLLGGFAALGFRTVLLKFHATRDER